MIPTTPAAPSRFASLGRRPDDPLAPFVWPLSDKQTDILQSADGAPYAVFGMGIVEGGKRDVEEYGGDRFCMPKRRLRLYQPAC